MTTTHEPSLKSFWGFIVTLVIALMILGGIARFAGLYYFPWEVQMKTEMLRGTNAYVTTQVSALRQLSASLVDPTITPAQRAAIKAQMRGLADQLPPGYMPADIQLLLSGE